MYYDSSILFLYLFVHHMALTKWGPGNCYHAFNHKYMHTIGQEQMPKNQLRAFS